MNKWLTTMAKYLRHISMTQTRCSFFQVIFVIGGISLSSTITESMMGKYGRAFRS